MSCRSPPVSNRLVAAAIRHKQDEQHRERMRNNPPAVDVSPPVTTKLVLNRGKEFRQEGHTQQQKENRPEVGGIGREDELSARVPTPLTLSLPFSFFPTELQSEIDRANARLLNKMTALLATRSFPDGSSSSSSSTSTSSPRTAAGKKTLHGPLRDRREKQICEQNSKLLDRIQEVKPTLSRVEWSKHMARHEAFLANLTVKPVPADPIPLPKFLSEGGGGGGAATERGSGSARRRPPHAYMQGQYGRTLSTSRRVDDVEQKQAEWDGTIQSARGRVQSVRQGSTASATASPVLHTLYQPAKPHRSGQEQVSKQHQPKVHQLQPLPEKQSHTEKGEPVPSNKDNTDTTSTPATETGAVAPADADPATVPAADPAPAPTPAPAPAPIAATTAIPLPNLNALKNMLQDQALQFGYTPLLQSSKSFNGGAELLLAVHEVPGTGAPAATDDTPSDTDATTSTPPAPPAPTVSSSKFLFSSSIDDSLPSFLFHLYDLSAQESHHVQVALSLLAQQGEVQADPSLLHAEQRARLAEVMSERLEMEGGQVRFRVEDALAKQ